MCECVNDEGGKGKIVCLKHLFVKSMESDNGSSTKCYRAL